jgi:hypothetical protein
MSWKASLETPAAAWRRDTHNYLEGDAITLTRGRIESLVMRIQTVFLKNPMLSLTRRRL